jgi:hypothetical protein
MRNRQGFEMNEFQRCLPKEALSALQDLHDAAKDNWWKELLALWAPSGRGPGLRLAIRKNTIDFYRNGNRVAHICFGKKKGDDAPPIYVETHVKYLRGEDAGDGQAKLRRTVDGWSWSESSERVSFANVVAAIDARMENLRRGKYPRKGLEKDGVDVIVGNNATVIDVEMGLPRDPNIANENGGAPRMDLVTLEKHGSEIRVIFWEVKTFDDPRLRIKEGAKASEVMDQLETYREYLRDAARRERIVSGYRETCRLLQKFWGMLGNEGCLHPLIGEAAMPESKLVLDSQPRLLIFNSANGKEIASDSFWPPHRTKIEEARIPVMINDRAAEIVLPVSAITNEQQRGAIVLSKFTAPSNTPAHVIAELPA